MRVCSELRVGEEVTVCDCGNIRGCDRKHGEGAAERLPASEEERVVHALTARLTPIVRDVLEETRGRSAR